MTDLISPLPDPESWEDQLLRVERLLTADVRQVGDLGKALATVRKLRRTMKGVPSTLFGLSSVRFLPTTTLDDRSYPVTADGAYMHTCLWCGREFSAPKPSIGYCRHCSTHPRLPEIAAHAADEKSREILTQMLLYFNKGAPE